MFMGNTEVLQLEAKMLTGTIEHGTVSITSQPKPFAVIALEQSGPVIHQRGRKVMDQKRPGKLKRNEAVSNPGFLGTRKERGIRYLQIIM